METRGDEEKAGERAANSSERTIVPEDEDEVDGQDDEVANRYDEDGDLEDKDRRTKSAGPEGLHDDAEPTAAEQLTASASSPPATTRNSSSLALGEKAVSWGHLPAQPATSLPPDLEAQGTLGSEELRTRMGRTQSVMASVQKRMHSLGKLGPEINRLTPGATLEGLDQAAWTAAAKESQESDSMFSTGRWSGAESQALGRKRSKLEENIERNLRQNRERTCWCLCNRASQFRLRDAIMVPFMILVVFGAVIIILVQSFFTRRIQDMYESSCNATTEAFIVDSIIFQLNNSKSMLASSLQSTTALIDLSIISDSFQTIVSTLTLFESLLESTNNATLIESLVSNALFRTLNSSFVPLVSGASVILLDNFTVVSPGVAEAELTLISYVFERSAPNEAYHLSADGEDSLLVWSVNRSTGNNAGPGESIPNSSLDLSGLGAQAYVVREEGQASRSFGAYTNFGYWLTADVITPALRYGFLLTYPINLCGNYECSLGYVQTNVLSSAVSAVSLSKLLEVQNESEVTNGDCEHCAQFFYVLRSVSTYGPSTDQNGLLVGGAVNGQALNVTEPVLAADYTASSIVPLLTDLVESLNLEDNQSVSVVRNISSGGNCSATLDQRLSDFDLEDLNENCLVISVGPMLGSSPDPSFPVYENFLWRAVLAVPATWGLVNYTDALSNSREGIAEINERTDDELRSLSSISAGVEAGMILLTLVLSFFIAALLARPIRRLTKEIRRLTKLEFRNKGVVMPRKERSRIKEVASTQREFVKMYYALETFSRFVPAAVVRNILRTKRGRRLNVQERVVTTMFSDIQGFTSIAEKLERVDLMYLITRYLTAMTAIVEQYEGVVAEIQGDGLLAFWNTPETIEDHATKALSAAIAQQQYLKSLSVQFQEEFRAKYDLGEFRVRIGIHTGPVLSGTIGSLTKYKFGSLGDAVNMASRLEGLSKLYGTQIICSEDALALCAFRDAFLLRELDLVQVKGKQRAARIFEVVLQKVPIECRFLSPYVATESDSETDDSDEDNDTSDIDNADEDDEGADSTDGETPAARSASKGTEVKQGRRRLSRTSGKETSERNTGLSGKFFFKSFRPLVPKPASAHSQGSGVELFDREQAELQERPLRESLTLESPSEEVKRFHPVSAEPLTSRDIARIDRYEIALRSFQEGAFRKAEQTLLGVADLDGDLDTAEKLLLERVREQLAHFGTDNIDAQSVGWTGVNTLASKSF